MILMAEFAFQARAYDRAIKVTTASYDYLDGADIVDSDVVLFY